MIKSWSYSSLSLYEQCPQKYKYIKIDKMEEPPSYFLKKGLDAHQKAEDYLNGKIKYVPAELAMFSDEFKNLRERGGKAELPIVLNKNWELLGYQDAWLHEDAWLRVKVDAQLNDCVIDFKTGKHYESHSDQAQLYALTLMLAQKIEEITVEFWYLPNGDVKSYEYSFSQVEQLKKIWHNKLTALNDDNTFIPKINLYCKYCSFMNICSAHARK